jgi:hypothetical protein
MKIAGSGSNSQRHGSANPDLDPQQNVMDPQNCQKPQRNCTFMNSATSPLVNIMKQSFENR